MAQTFRWWGLIAGIALFVIAFGVRAAYVLHTRTDQQPFFLEMELAGISLAEHGYLGNVYAEDSGPSAHVSPLYAMLLAAFHGLLGPRSSAAVLCQQFFAITVTALIIAWVPRLARRCGLHAWTGWLAAVFLALSPLNLWIETSGSWEQPCAAGLSILLFHCFLRLHDGAWQSRCMITLLGILLGISALLSPALLPFAFLAICGELLVQRGWRARVLKATVAVVLLSAVMVVPWAIRNYQVFDRFVPLRSNFGLELYLGNNSQANGKTFSSSWSDEEDFLLQNHPFTSERERAHLQEVGEINYMSEKGDQGRDWIQEHPGAFVRLTVARFRYYWFPDVELWSPETQMRLVKAVAFTLLGAGSVVMLGWLFWTQHRYRWLFLAVLVGPSLIYMVTHVDPRYRYPTFWVSALLSCEGVVRMVRAFWRSDASSK